MTGVQTCALPIFIYNPVVTDKLLEEARAPVPHPWLAPGEPPVVLGAGRLGDQKDFATLVRAFALLARDLPDVSAHRRGGNG